MDPLSASCLTLNYDPSSQILAQKETEEKYFQILGSTVSISNYEKKNFKTLIPQILAAILATSYHVSIGISLAFSAILLPQLEEDPRFEVSKSQASWIASIIALTTLVGSLIVGPIMDYFGRLRTLTMAAIPGVGGCVVMALADSVSTIIIGRALVGFSAALGSNPAVVYLAEIARKDMRGSLIAFAPGLTSLGMVLAFIMGWFMNWRQVSWLTSIITAIPCILFFFIPESPAWLVSKDRIEDARKSLIWINKYQPIPETKDISIPELQLALLQKEHELKMIEVSRRKENELMAKVRGFLDPTGYRPLLMITGLFFFQQFSGIFVFLFYSITFFKEVGSTANPYLTSIFIGVVRFTMSMLNTYLQRTFNRRTVMLISCLGMSASIGLSGLFSNWIINGSVTATWIPVVFLLTFVVTSMIGIIPVPFTMAAELFPLEIRGIAQSLSLCICNVLMFIALQLHPFIHEWLGGIVGVQYYFGTITLVAVVYSYIFMPETQGKKLTEIEDYFRKNVIFLGSDKVEAESVKMPVRRNIVRRQQSREHQESLLEEA